MKSRRRRIGNGMSGKESPKAPKLRKATGEKLKQHVAQSGPIVVDMSHAGNLAVEYYLAEVARLGIGRVITRIEQSTPEFQTPPDLIIIDLGLLSNFDKKICLHAFRQLAKNPAIRRAFDGLEKFLLARKKNSTAKPEA